MREQLFVIFPQQEAVENEVKLVLTEAATPTIMDPSYINFGREIYKTALRFSGGQLIATVDMILSNGLGRGLDLDILERIRSTVFTLTAPTP